MKKSILIIAVIVLSTLSGIAQKEKEVSIYQINKEAATGFWMGASVTKGIRQARYSIRNDRWDKKIFPNRAIGARAMIGYDFGLGTLDQLSVGINGGLDYFVDDSTKCSFFRPLLGLKTKLQLKDWSEGLYFHISGNLLGFNSNFDYEITPGIGFKWGDSFFELGVANRIYHQKIDFEGIPEELDLQRRISNACLMLTAGFVF